MSVSVTVLQSSILPLIDFRLSTDIIAKKLEKGPKGYKAFRYVASSNIIDHDGEIVDIQGLAEVMNIMQKQGARFQGIHTNFPAGEFFDWGFCKVADKLSIYIDVEIYDDYPSQQDFLSKIELPWGHKDKIGGVSLGGKVLESERKCDQDRCWTHIKKLEGWEFSGVNHPANDYARRINEETNTLEGLNLPVVYLGKTIIGKETVNKMNQPRNEQGQFSKKDDCDDCPDEITKMACPKCDGNMEGDKCNKCGYAKEAMDGESSENGYDQTMEDENMTSDMQEIKQMLGTMMDALNIGKDQSERFLKLEKSINAIATTVSAIKKEQKNNAPPAEFIEHEGMKYKIVKEDEDKSEPETTEFDKVMKDMADQMTELKKSLSETTSGGDARDADPYVEDPPIKVEKTVQNADIMKSEIKKFEDSGLNFEEAEYMARANAIQAETEISLEDLDMYIQ